MENYDMQELEVIKEEIINGRMIGKAEALFLVKAPLEELCSAADEIREYFCGSSFDICTIVNAKSGRCTEDCKYCAQSVFYGTGTEEYPLLDMETIVDQAAYNHERGVLRYSLVASGRSMPDPELDLVCESIRKIKSETGIEVCTSLGLLGEEQFRKLKEAGVSRIHNNLETSRGFFTKICTTHTYDEKIDAIKSAQKAGLKVCSGGIMGLGETMEDRIDMVLEIRGLGIKSIPVNMLNPIAGTPYEGEKQLEEDEMRRISAVFRFLVPDASIRMAGGRGLLADKGRSCFKSGANAAISGDMLTTAGISIREDMGMLKELGYKAVLWDE